MTAFFCTDRFAFVRGLEASFGVIRRDLQQLTAADFVASPDSLTTVADGYDETGWSWYGLFGGDGDAARRVHCPATARALDAVPGLVNAGFSRFCPGTHLYPHCGELGGVLRCHLPLLVPDGDVALRIGSEVRRWQPGRCVVFDDNLEHDAWNRGASDRVVLLITFARPAVG